MKVALEIESEEFAAVIFELLIDQRKDTLTKCLQSKDVLKGTITETIANYIQRRKDLVNQLVPAAAQHAQISATPTEARRWLTASLLAQPQAKQQIFAEFLHQMLSDLCQDTHLAGVVTNMMLSKTKGKEL